MLSAGTLRDAAEALLLVAATDTPTAQGGVVSFFADLVPELDVRWSHEAGCDRATLDLTVRRTGVMVSAHSRERREFQLNGQAYVLAVDTVAPSHAVAILWTCHLGCVPRGILEAGALRFAARSSQEL
jgi:hypothetical protein